MLFGDSGARAVDYRPVDVVHVTEGTLGALLLLEDLGHRDVGQVGRGHEGHSVEGFGIALGKFGAESGVCVGG